MSTLLRKQFNDHMILRGLSPNTKDAYTGAVAGLANYYHLSPDKLDNDQIQAYLLYLIQDPRIRANKIIFGLLLKDIL